MNFLLSFNILSLGQHFEWKLIGHLKHWIKVIESPVKEHLLQQCSGHLNFCWFWSTYRMRRLFAIQLKWQNLQQLTVEHLLNSDSFWLSSKLALRLRSRLDSTGMYVPFFLHLKHVAMFAVQSRHVKVFMSLRSRSTSSLNSWMSSFSGVLSSTPSEN